MSKVNMWRHVGDALGQLTVSKEEADLLAQENVELIANSEHELADAERHTEIAENLEDVAAVADKVTNAEPKDLAFIDTNVSMATAGTGIASEEVMPALESYTGGTIDTRGLKATAEGFRSAVSETMSTIGARVSGGLGSASKQAAQLKAELAGVTTGSNLELKLGSHLVKTLTRGDRVVGTGAELIQALKDQINQTEVALVNYTEQLSKSAGMWINIFKGLSDDKHVVSGDVGRAAIAAMNFNSIASALKATPGHDSRYEDVTLRIAPPLLGRASIYIVSSASTASRENPVEDFTDSYATLQKPGTTVNNATETFTFRDAGEIATVKQLVLQLLELTTVRGKFAQNTMARVAIEADQCHRILSRWMRLTGYALTVGSPVPLLTYWAIGKVWDLAHGHTHVALVALLNSYHKKVFQPALPLAQHNVYVAKGLLGLLKATA